MSLVALATAIALNAMPDRTKTPGAMRADIGVTEVCTIKWGQDRRHVTARMKRDVLKAYAGRITCKAGQCEIDHLVPRELGGADDVLNLWPEPYDGPWGAHAKDKLENCMHVRVCDTLKMSGKVAGQRMLDDYQWQMASDWPLAYRALISAEGSCIR